MKSGIGDTQMRVPLMHGFPKQIFGPLSSSCRHEFPLSDLMEA
jgi:hypothetical protein